MNIIGDLERLFATSLYPNRIPIAIGLVLTGVALVLLARRRGWFAAARRHPGRTAAVAALALAIGLPTAWYLGSPLLIRTSLIEPAPVVGTPAATRVPGPSPASMPEPSQAPGATAGDATAAPTTAPAPTPLPTPPLAAPRSGTFHGADDFHFGSGSATLIETAPGAWTVRFEGFSVRNGPDLFVYVSPDPGGYAESAIELGRLKATDGSFNMDLPPGAIPTDAASVVIWCRQFAVQFAVAPLEG
ncbi:MAG TPA: DM13 domain-containing protein [Candidatus Sulfomarinibacteraceae bacterium]|nr:DM13 domain-containing protein [Candidatus Sulfomarinibacteraceae bacterium]